MNNMKKIRVTLAFINVILAAIEVYYQWQVIKSQKND